jgi:hypothetical protein
MKNTGRLFALLALTVATAGCGLCFLPCYVCAGVSNPQVEGPPQAFPEIGPALVKEVTSVQVPRTTH